MTQIYTDFGEYALGAQPTGWTTCFSTSGGYTVNADAAATGGKLLSNTAVTGSFIGLMNDSLGLVADAEIYVRGKTGSTLTVAQFRAWLRADVASTTVQRGYVADLFNGVLRILVYSASGSATVLASTAFAIAANTRYKIRFRAEGTTLTAKAWNDTDAEPSSWMLTVTNAVWASGSVGLNVYKTDNAIDDYGAGTNGDVAPTSAPGGGTPATYTLDLTASIGAASSFVRGLARTFSSTTTTTPSTIRSVGLTLATSSSVSPTLERQSTFRRVLTASANVGTSFMSALVGTVQTYYLTLTATIATTPVVTRLIVKPLIVVSTFTATVAKSTTKLLVLVANVAPQSTVVRSLSKSLVVSVNVTSSLRRSIAKSFVTSVGWIASLVQSGRQALGALNLRDLFDKFVTGVLLDRFDIESLADALEVGVLSTGTYHPDEVRELDVEVVINRPGVTRPSEITSATWTLTVRGTSTVSASGTCTIDGLVATAFVTMPAVGRYILEYTVVVSGQTLKQRRNIEVT